MLNQPTRYYFAQLMVTMPLLPNSVEAYFPAHEQSLPHFAEDMVSQPTSLAISSNETILAILSSIKLKQSIARPYGNPIRSASSWAQSIAANAVKDFARKAKKARWIQSETMDKFSNSNDDERCIDPDELERLESVLARAC